MPNFILLGDATDHGGRVITASTTMIYDGRRIAHKGDEVTCPKHLFDIKPNLIIDGDEEMLDEGVPIARHGYRAMCGCHLISGLL